MPIAQVNQMNPTHPPHRLASPAFLLKTLSLSLLMAYGSTLYALPISPTVTVGAATVATPAGNSMVITQATQNAVLQWQTFNVGASESVRFIQPNSQSVALNRVLGSDPSRILGSISANGKVFLVNPQGILFGQGASVNVGGLVASTLDITDADLLAGRYRFSGSNTGEIRNQGHLRANGGGFVAMLAPQVFNEGTVQADTGSVHMAAGQAVTLDVSGDGLLLARVDQAAAQALVSNAGLIQADGGAVVLSAQAKDALLATVVNNTGIVQAHALGQRNGRIVLDGGNEGVVAVSGALRAQGLGAGESGGVVVATGDKVLLTDSARLDATGAAGGGGIYVGGGWQGGDPGIRQARGVYVAAGATLDASATQRGAGGTVVAWSAVQDAGSTTRVHGTLRARGGEQGGDGGRIETSGHWLDVAGLRADAAAPKGNAGVWLVDPEDLVVGLAPTDATFSAGPPALFTSGAGTPNVLNVDVETQLNAGTSVVLQTAPTGGGAGDITLAAPIAKTAGGNAALTLNAHGSIVFAPGVTVGSSAGALQVNLQAPTSVQFGVGSDIISNGGNITLTTATLGGGTPPPLLGTGVETLTLNFTGATAIDLGAPGGGIFLPAGFATNFGQINVVSAGGNVNANAPMGFVDSVSISTGGNITINAGAGIATSKPGGTLALSGATFNNLGGAGSVFTTGGSGSRWVIYSNDPSGNTFGGLTSGNAAVWGQTFGSLPPGGAPSGDRYVFATPGAVTVTTTSPPTKPYGQTLDVSPFVTYSGAPLNAAASYGNVFLDVPLADVFSTLPTVSSAGASAAATVAGGPYPVIASGAVANAGYSVSYINSGWLAVDQAILEIMALGDSRFYNGQAYTGGNGLQFTGFLNGDTASVLGGSLVYTGSSQGALHAGSYAIAPSGFTSNDYTIRYVNGVLTIAPKPVTVSGLVANSKDFDGSAVATMRSWGSVPTGVGSETLGLNHGAATFGDANVGSGKTVTVDGYSLVDGANGGLARNYVLTGTVATTQADIFPAQRGQTVRAVQSALSYLFGPTAAPQQGNPPGLDASAWGLSPNVFASAGATPAPSGTPSPRDPNAALVLRGNRLLTAVSVGASGTTAGTPPGAFPVSSGPAGSSQGSSSAASGTTRLRTAGLSSPPKAGTGVVPRAPGALQAGFVSKSVRAAVVGSTSSGAAIVASQSGTGLTARWTVTVAPGDGFGVAIPRELLGKPDAKGTATPFQARTPGGALPSWMRFDPQTLRLTTTGVPSGALPLTVRVLGASGKVVEVLFK